VKLLEWLSSDIKADEEISFRRDFNGIDIELLVKDYRYKLPKYFKIGIPLKYFSDDAVIASIQQARKMIEQTYKEDRTSCW